MDLKEARAIARQVGATIEEKKLDKGRLGIDYIVRLGVCKINSNGVREAVELHARTPHEAADLACVETGRNARALVEVAKRVYSDSDLIFGAPRS